MSEHVSDYQLDALRLGTADDVEALEAHLRSCPACAARRDALAEEAGAFAARFEAAGLAADALQRAEAKRTPWWRRIVPAASVAAAAAALAVAFLVIPQDELRTKGEGPRVEVFVVSSGADLKPMRGPVAPDAHLAVRVRRAGQPHVRVLWESAPDEVGALYPDEVSGSWSAKEERWLPNEIVLDGAKAAERLLVVFCEAPQRHADALGVIRGESGRSDCTLEAVRIEKR